MTRYPLILFMLVITLANLVYAADEHEGHHQGDGAPSFLFEGHIEAHDHEPTSMEDCSQAQSCQAHSHIFSPVAASWPDRLIKPLHDQPERVSLPAQQGAAPPVPPPIA